MIDAEQYNVIRQQVEQRFRQRYAFYAHVAVYTVVNLLLWLVYLFTAGMAEQITTRFPIPGVYTLLSFPWPLVVMAGWGVGLILHSMNYYIRYGGGAMRRRLAIQREIEQEIALSYGYDKPKNDMAMRLTDDGEIEEVVDYEDQWLEHSKRQ